MCRLFFFQAEDGIRDLIVTGVQTCALPISYTGQAEIQRDIANFKAALGAAGMVEGFLPVAAPASVIPDRRNEYYKGDADCLHRSEERRVGKECRSRGAPYH